MKKLGEVALTSSEKTKRYYRAHREEIAVRRKANYHKDRARAMAYSRAYLESNRDVVFAKRLFKEHGMTRDEYDLLLEQQDGCCAICQKRKTLHIDHCHTTGEVRGLLCIGCNTALGKLGDDLKGLRAAVAYLEQA